MTAPTDRVEQEGDWRFDAEVTDVFDDMLARSIPQYETMRETVLDFASVLAPDRADLRFLDLGTSRGEVLMRFVERFGSAATYLGVEISEPMADVADARFETNPNVEIDRGDLRVGLPTGEYDVVTAVLTACFVPIEHRQRMLSDVYRALPSDGVFVIVEKVLGDDARIDEAITTVYRQLKAKNGYSWESIERKAHALEGVLVPVTAQMNVELLRSAGFSSVDSVWRWGPFVCWVCLP